MLNTNVDVSVGGISVTPWRGGSLQLSHPTLSSRGCCDRGKEDKLLALLGYRGGGQSPQ